MVSYFQSAGVVVGSGVQAPRAVIWFPVASKTDDGGRSNVMLLFENVWPFRWRTPFLWAKMPSPPAPPAPGVRIALGGALTPAPPPPDVGVHATLTVDPPFGFW